MSTLADLRSRLNEQLGSSDGQDIPWGDVPAKNSAIRWALEQLEPTMMLLTEEAVTPLAATRKYPLTDVEKVTIVEMTDSSGRVRDIKNYRSITVDGVTTLAFSEVPDSTVTLNVVGYKPYTSALTADDDITDLPASLDWIPLQGALAELYRRRFHQWIDYERYNASNPSTVVDPDLIYRAYTDALAKFEQAKLDHMRKVAMPRRASFSR